MTKEHMLRTAVSGLSGTPRTERLMHLLKHPEELKAAVVKRLNALERKGRIK